ncbi:MAG: hypothetical protein ACYC9O_11545 [Candidatus Latescibacterota bacterium]
MKKVFWPMFVFLPFLLALLLACSREIETYDSLEQRGIAEETVRKKYGNFFDAVRELELKGSAGEPDSSLIRKASAATDRVAADVRAFPQTVESRLALDALSYAARDLARSSGFSRFAIIDFWSMALLNPLFVTGREFAKTGQENVSTRMQLVKALQRGMDKRATTQMFLDILPIFGTAPDSSLMRFAATDSLVFRRIHDLILYARSRQPAPPPYWLATGAWLMAIDIPGFFPGFFAFAPIIEGRDMYFATRRYDPGEVYERVFRDPAPQDPSGNDAWIARAGAAMNPLVCDDAFADSARTSGLPIFDAHYFFNDYLIQTDADSVKKEFIIILKRDKLTESGFEFIGADSMAVTFSLPQLSRPEGKVTVLRAERHQGASLMNGQVTPGKSGTGKAYLMELGEHSDAILRKLQEASLPKISVNSR